MDRTISNLTREQLAARNNVLMRAACSLMTVVKANNLTDMLDSQTAAVMADHQAWDTERAEQNQATQSAGVREPATA